MIIVNISVFVFMVLNFIRDRVLVEGSAPPFTLNVL